MKLTLSAAVSPEEVQAVLARVPALLAGHEPDPTGLVRQIQLAMGTQALSLVKDAFVTKSQGGIDETGAKWKPLAASTQKKRRKGTAQALPQILRDSGRLFNSFSPALAVRTEPGHVFVGTNVAYAGWQHDGTATIPARPLWPAPATWPQRWWEAIGSVAREGIVGLIAALLGGTLT